MIVRSWQEEVRETYRLSFPGKLENLRRLFEQFASDGEEASREALRVAFHRIRGSAGSYDYGDLGELCGQCEDELISIRTSGVPAATVLERIRPRLDAFERLIRSENK